VGGLAAFVLFGGLAAVGVTLWMGDARSIAALSSAAIAAPIVATLAAAFVETTPIRLNDNVSVPATAALVLWSFTFVDDAALRAAAELAAGRVLPALAINLGVAALGYAARTVTVAGAIAGAVIGLVIYVGAGAAGWTMLLASFLFAAVTTRVGGRRKAEAGIAESRGGRRGPGNALANTGLAAYAAGLSLGLPDPALAHLAMTAALVTSASDTVASEIGKAWGRTTWLLTSFRRVPPGTTGAISVEGTAAGVASAGALAGLAAALGLMPAAWIVLVVMAATVASLVEGLLGATLERSGMLNNDALNFVNAGLGAGLALLGAVWL
jgi:uncharacterized protein (TIGR00297 family)